jgi:hypothetical protein
MTTASMRRQKYNSMQGRGKKREREREREENKKKKEREREILVYQCVPLSFH